MERRDEGDFDDEVERGSKAARPGSRRRFLAAAGALGLSGLAGCNSLPFDTNENEETTTGSGEVGLGDFRGSGPLVSDRPAPGGTSMDELPALEGELTVYLGGGEGGLYTHLMDLLRKKYPKFELKARKNSSASLANTIVEERKNGTSPADVFFAVDAGSLGAVADAGAAAKLPERVTNPVPSDFRDPKGRWVGVAGRARTIVYNTGTLSADGIPNDVMKLPERSDLVGRMGWAPTYSAFQSFVTAMRLQEGRAATKRWLTAMKEGGIGEYPNEFFVSNAVADGEIDAGFANHYYALRVKNNRPDAEIDLAFTEGDAGALVNVSGAQIVEGTDQRELAANFIHHLLSAEAQEFFATVTYGYPMIPEVEPVGGLPTIDELNPPDIDLTNLSDVQPTLKLMREADVL